MNSGDFADGCHIYGTVIEESAILQKIYQKQENYFTGCFRYLKKEKEISTPGRSEQGLPHYILFIAEEKYLDGEMFSKYIFNKKEN